VTDAATSDHALLRRGVNLERMTLAWNVVGIVVLGFAAVAARSVALAGFGLDSLVEIGASTVVLWELSGTGQQRQRRALRLIGAAFRRAGGLHRSAIDRGPRQRLSPATQSRWDRMDSGHRGGDVRSGRGEGQDGPGTEQPGAGD
jgi:hypothetical protein